MPRPTPDAILAGKPWTVMVTRDLPGYDGMTYHDTDHIEISSRVRKRNELETWIHEMAHAQMPWMTEDAITQLAAEQAVVLWKLGYRKSE